MKVTVQHMMSISGSTSNDPIVTNDFVKEVTAEVDKRVAVLIGFRDLMNVIDREGLGKCADAMAGISQLYDAVASVAGFHRNGQLAKPLEKLAKDVEQKRSDAKNTYNSLRSFLP